MAKDVDLSSKEWTDLVFEGKNKEFGAYELRSGSVKRHNFAVISVFVVLALILTFLILWMTGVFKSADEDVNANLDKEVATLGVEEEAEEEEETIDIPEEVPEEEKYQEQEDVTASQAVTELVIKQEVDAEKEVRDKNEITENTALIGNQNQEGKEDLNKEQAKEKIVEKAPEPKVEEAPKPKDEGPVNMAMVEQKPSFPGGEGAMYAWLSSNVSYPAAASEEGVSGKVTVSFIVEKDGHISNVHVVRGKHPALDAEAVRVVKKMPKWTPGRNNGQPVRVTYMLPVTFKLQ